MNIVVMHRIADPEKFFNMDAEQEATNGPPEVSGRQSLSSSDRSAPVCLGCRHG